MNTGAVYVDSSVLVAAVAPDETGADRATAWVNTQPLAVTSALAEVELFRALSRKPAPDLLFEAARLLLSTCQLIEISAEIRTAATRIRPTSLRSLDAIHVATALVADLDDFFSFDFRQQVAAEEAGLRLVK